ncbi:fimbria/pilus outer membrane usher protein [Acinetobacter junii]|uniref:fimbria/pilus outer membrane usher protein n=1 Tax=Acinetobacter junii TaxID=40215 RepID=UPI00244B1871|nr:fimbria/pilus outer membrane usher protein [Acinetobacter junii]MDH1915922.1 fimbria/pilus outer membrane usher protein [Acinetobacter junii]
MIKKTILTVQIVCLCTVGYAYANVENERLILANIWVNGLETSTETLVLQQDQKNYIECRVLESLTLKASLFQKNSEDNQYCLVSTQEINSKIDPSSQSLKITIPTQYFMGYADRTSILQPHKASLGAFLNYDFFYNKYDEGSDFNSYYELGVFKDFWLLNNAFIYRENSENQTQKVVRLNTSLDIDFPERYTRLTLGDNASLYNPLINSFRFGGLSYGTNFTERSDFIYWNTPVLRGSAIVPSTIDLYINGINIYRQNVTPGDYTLQTGANIQQAGTAQVVVEDILGNRSVQSFPVYINNRLLKKGLSEYNISLGKLRYNYDYDSNDYRDFFSNLYFRKGITDSTSLGFNAAYSESIKNIGLMWTQSLFHSVLLDTNAVASSAEGRSGYSLGIAMSDSFDSFSVGFNSKYSSQDFRALGYSDQVQNPRFEHLGYISFFKIPYINNLNLNYIERNYYQNTEFPLNDTKMLSVGLSKTFTPKLSMGLSYFKDFGSSDDTGAYFSLSYNFDQNRSVYFDQSSTPSTRLTYAKSSSEQVGFDYSVGVDHNNGNENYNAFGLLKNTFGDLRIQHTQNDEHYNSQVNYRGALVWLNRQLNLSKSVDNAFALVKVGDTSNIDVFRSLAPIGQTNRKGYVFIHDILPYINYDLSFDQDQIPIEYKVDNPIYKIVALNQRGYFVDFPVVHTQQVIVKLKDRNGNLFPRASKVYINHDENNPYPVDKEGNVYLYGLVPATYQLNIQADTPCQAPLSIQPQPNSTATVQSIELVCQ